MIHPSGWMARVLLPLSLLVTALVLMAYQHHVIPSPRVAAVAVKSVPPTSGATFDLGVTTLPLARNWYQPWQQSALASANAFERDARKHAEIVMWYADWQHDEAPLPAQLTEVARRKSIPEITWEPWDASKRLYVQQPRYRLRNIIEGKFDAYIWRWAHGLAAWRRTVLLRFAQEMDGNWYPWDDYANGNRPGDFVQAWRHVHRIFTAAGATNVKWVWTPAFARPAEFPGVAYVDIIGTTCQNGDRHLFRAGWRSFARICGKKIDFLHRLAPGLPIQLAEVSSGEAGGSKAEWIAGMFSYLAGKPEVSSLIWFNLRKESDWRIESSGAAQRQFAMSVRSNRFN
jgi:hypothetical protein